MATYVDPLFPTPDRSPKWPYKQACHLTADSSEELEAMARTLKLDPSWVQFRGTWKEHYDLVPSKRAAAVRAGAVELSAAESADQSVRRHRQASPRIRQEQEA